MTDDEYGAATPPCPSAPPQHGSPPASAPRVASAARHQARVLQSQRSGASFHKLRLECAPLAEAARPGQFVHVLPQQSSAAPSYDPLLRRAFSVMSTSLVQPPGGTSGDTGSNIDGGTQEAWLEILFRVGGKGTSLLAQCRPGDTLDVLGPLGNGFDWERASQPGTAARPLFLVGGGIGVPPLVFTVQTVAQRLAQAAGDVSREATPAVEVFVGARTAGELVEQEALQSSGALVHIATDDGSQGTRGVVTQPLRERLAVHRAAAGQAWAGSNWAKSGPLVCACGPWPMLGAVAQVCREMGAECQVSLEESMPCGIGVCNGCVVPVLDAADEYGRFQRICVHGPVLDARSVDWGDLSLSGAGPSVPAAVDGGDGESQEGASQ